MAKMTMGHRPYFMAHSDEAAVANQTSIRQSSGDE